VTLGRQGRAGEERETAGACGRAVDAGPGAGDDGSGDAFNGGLAVALAEGREIIEAVRSDARLAGISVTRAGTGAFDAASRRGGSIVGRR